MAVCLVTGGAGFIGSHLVEALVERGHRVRVVDNGSACALINLTAVGNKIELIVGDVADLDLVRRSVRGAELIFHLASPVFSTPTHADPNGVRWACAMDVLHVLIAAHEADVRRVIYASSASVYGNQTTHQPLCEADPPAPASPYAFAKLTGEQHCLAFTKAHGLETVGLRYFHVFGPRQLNFRSCGQVISIVRAMLAGQRPVLDGGGDVAQDLTYVDDVVQANLLAAETPRASGRVYNIARGRTTTLGAVVATVNALLGTELEPVAGSDATPGLQYGAADISRAEAELGFCAGTDLEQGLRRCILDCAPERLGPGLVRPPHRSTDRKPHLSKANDLATYPCGTKAAGLEPGET